ncbi:hypothetical protein SSABA_v1c09110 [Spiroplasma sabaudiense Ar-1343]|uniref:Uncharacterized protein n=1 Tax=Spiroplasma sabaudiense Ar-1343 TaxID=1276257 RepID=W6ABU3_9MOLU|nr:hypothetical protein [Spiroplasma sabaudiense]AHI54310.1 hypothetical protein SSABA_v1c09110 [Spiroplasma sabaudiense Ar-1343]
MKYLLSVLAITSINASAVATSVANKNININYNLLNENEEIQLQPRSCDGPDVAYWTAPTNRPFVDISAKSSASRGWSDTVHSKTVRLGNISEKGLTYDDVKCMNQTTIYGEIGGYFKGGKIVKSSPYETLKNKSVSSDHITFYGTKELESKTGWAVQKVQNSFELIVYFNGEAFLQGTTRAYSKGAVSSVNSVFTIKEILISQG